MSHEAQVETVKAFLRRAKTAVSEGDVAAGTGLDVGTAKTLLYDLMRSHRAALSVHDDGTLVYDFGPKLVPLGKRSWRQRLAVAARWLWKGFSWLYKASLAIVLVAYAITFVVLLIAMAVAASAASESEGPAEGALHLVGGIFRAIFEFMTHAPILYTEVDRHGYRHHHYEPRSPVLPRRKPKEHEKGFVASVYDFVLGPARVEPPELAQEREVAAFVRKNGGVLTVRDVQALSGMTRPEAEQFFARFVAEQDGVAEITDEGALYATFDELLRSQSKQHDDPVVFYWDEYEAPFELTGNSTGKNIAIALLAAFNLFGSFLVLNAGAALGDLSLPLGIVPAIIFSLFFAIPLLRAPWLWWKNRQQHAHNIRKRLYRVIFGANDERLAGPELVERANRRATTEEKLRIADISELVDETLLDVGGEQGVDARGEATMDLTRIQIEAQAVEEHALAERQAQVVYRTDEPR